MDKKTTAEIVEKGLPEGLFNEISGGKSLKELEQRILTNEKKKWLKQKREEKRRNTLKKRNALVPPKVIGLTGGIGTGKTVLAKYVESLGIPIYISDDHARKIVNSKKITEKIIKIWGEEVMSHGHIDRKKLGELIFYEIDERKKLNKLIHPLVKKHWERWLILHHQHEWVLKESAILLEVGGDAYCEWIISVFSGPKSRIERIMARDKVCYADAKQKMRAQWKDKQRFDKSDFIIENNSIYYSIYQLDKILKKILVG